MHGGRRPAGGLVPRIERTSTIVWEGNLARGAGALTAGSGAFAGLGYSLPTRIGQPEGKTSPEELLAAAHGGCLTMGLAGELSGSDTPPGRLEVNVMLISRPFRLFRPAIRPHIYPRRIASGGPPRVSAFS